jgi:class 3 adenylate cyclase/Tol biopolymer transport system component
MQPTRKLAAVLAADVAGYSRLMGDDEAATVRTLTEYREVFVERIARHRGRVVDTAGDSVLSVFESSIDAVECSIEVQRELARRNQQLVEYRRMRFRIGINLGEILSKDDGTVYGDGVNIAARLEALADPGGVCVSGTVYDHIEGKVLQSFKFAGEQTVKNIAKPVRAYHVVMEAAATTAPRVPYHPATGDRQEAGKSAAGAGWTRYSALTTLTSSRLTLAMALLVVLTSAIALWIWLRGGPDSTSASMRRATIDLTGHADPRSHYYGLYQQASWFALSLDGLLVYTHEGSTDAMLSRRLDAPTPQPLEGTSGGATPFLSPDGQMLGFERDGGMFVVPMSGGPTTRVKDAVFLAWGGRPAWTPDGRIIYTSEHGALVMVRPDGSSSEQLTTPAEGTRHLSPVVLPGGRTVLFTEIAGNVHDARILALSLSDRRTRELVSGGAITPQYADGVLFYCRPDGALMAAPFDAARVELTGHAHALPDRVDRSRFGVAHYATAPGVLLYAPIAQTRLVEMDATGGVTVLTEEGRWHMPRYSPDGARIVLDHITGEGVERDVWTLSRVDKTLSRVTRVGDAHDPTWLPNGKEVSFLSLKSLGGPLMIAAADGSGEPQPVRVAGPFRPIGLVNPGVWLSDGSAYLAGVVERSGNGAIWRLPRDGAPALKIVAGPFDEHSPSVSTDGRWLAYQSNETGRPEVYVRPLSGVEGRLQVSSAGATAPIWDKRNLTLYYLEADGARLHLVAASLRTAPALAVVGRRVVLPDVRVQEVENHANYDVDPSGTRFVMPEQAPTVGLGAIFDIASSLRGAKTGQK